MMNAYMLRHSILLLFLMALAAIMAACLKPHEYLANSRGDASLDDIMPTRFDGWKIEPTSNLILETPELTVRLSKSYDEILTRTYINKQGQRIMLSIAYGRDQRGEGRTHYPEVCYPAQGFQVGQTTSSILDLSGRRQPLNRLVASQVPRIEPITYWMVVGDYAVLKSLSHKKRVFIYGLQGQIPDGLLFRVSSIDADIKHAYALHEDFIRSLYQHLSAAKVSRLFGEV
jgi:EpsI family protein